MADCLSSNQRYGFAAAHHGQAGQADAEQGQRGGFGNLPNTPPQTVLQVIDFDTATTV